MADGKIPALGTTGHNTITRDELAAFYMRQGYQAGDWAAAVFDDIAAHRETGAPAAAPPLVAADLESRIADLENTIGQATIMTESMAEGGQISPDCARRLLSTLGDGSARDAEQFVRGRGARS